MDIGTCRDHLYVLERFLILVPGADALVASFFKKTNPLRARDDHVLRKLGVSHNVPVVPIHCLAPERPTESRHVLAQEKLVTVHVTYATMLYHVVLGHRVPRN